MFRMYVQKCPGLSPLRLRTLCTAVLQEHLGRLRPRALNVPARHDEAFNQGQELGWGCILEEWLALGEGRLVDINDDHGVSTPTIYSFVSLAPAHIAATIYHFLNLRRVPTHCPATI